MTMNTPTPAPTLAMSTMLGMLPICVASTLRSGSATVTTTPTTRATSRMNQTLRVEVTFSPICSPAGSMKMLLPSV